MTETLEARSVWRRRIGVIVLAGAFIAGVVLQWAGVVKIDAEAIAEAIRGVGPWGAVVLIAAFAAGTLINIPGLVFIGAAIAIYGTTTGYFVALAGATASVNLTFALARWFGFGEAKSLDRPWLRRVTGKLEARPILSLIVLRAIILVSPPINYALALTRLRHRDYAIGSGLGLVIPLWVVAHGFGWVLR